MSGVWPGVDTSVTLADSSAEIDDAPRLRSRHCRIGKIEFRLVALGLGLRQIRHGAFVLCLQRAKLPLR